MSQIVATFDTITKKLSVTIDGTEMSDVASVDFYRACSYDDCGNYSEDDPKWCGSVRQSVMNKENGTRIYTSTTASEDGGLVREETNKAIADFLSK